MESSLVAFPSYRSAFTRLALPILQILTSTFIVGPWSHVSKYGGLLYIAGQRGYDADTDKLVETNVAPGVNNTLPGYTRIKKAYEDMLSIAAAAGATPQDCVVSCVPQGLHI